MKNAIALSLSMIFLTTSTTSLCSNNAGNRKVHGLNSSNHHRHEKHNGARSFAQEKFDKQTLEAHQINTNGSSKSLPTPTIAKKIPGLAQSTKQNSSDSIKYKKTRKRR